MVHLSLSMLEADHTALEVAKILADTLVSLAITKAQKEEAAQIFAEFEDITSNSHIIPDAYDDIVSDVEETLQRWGYHVHSTQSAFVVLDNLVRPSRGDWVTDDFEIFYRYADDNEAVFIQTSPEMWKDDLLAQMNSDQFYPESWLHVDDNHYVVLRGWEPQKKVELSHVAKPQAPKSVVSDTRASA